MHIDKKPINRSKIRMAAGKKYYLLKRYLDWFLSGKQFAIRRSVDLLAYPVFSHSTPLIRKLLNVDMYLQYNKITNLKLATERLNGIIIKPGEVFSYWKLIGKPTYQKGYLDGLVLKPNGTFGPGVGGGLCQLSNLLFWMTLHTPLTVTERHRHSYDFFPDENRTQPFGTGATCSYCSYDLQFYNGTDCDYQLVVGLDQDSLIGQWRSTDACRYNYEIYEKEHAFTSGFGRNIRSNVIYRRTYDQKRNLMKDQFIMENHAYMTYPPFLGAGRGTEIENEQIEKESY